MKPAIYETWRNNGFIGAIKLYQILKDHYNYDEIKSVLDKQKTYQLHQQSKIKIKGRIVAFKPYERLQVDLLDMSMFSRQNKGFRWILIAIDIFTRQGFAVPIKRKMANDVRDGFKSILDNIKYKVERIDTDDGGEFKGSFKKMIQQKDIFHVVYPGVVDHFPLGVVNALSKNIKNMLYKTMINNNDTKWIDYLKPLINSYNNRPHSGLKGVKPNEALKHHEKILMMNLDKQDDIDIPFKIGELVRVRNKKGALVKGYIPKWSDETYNINRISGVHAFLNTGKKVRLEDLLKVKPIIKNEASIESLNNALKDQKTVKNLKREGIFDDIDFDDEQAFKRLTKG
eukprot:NODE_496_length_2180_cov_18.490380_g456_i0.p1 GENE.NODE_496_length_2180_cov_18.490380_g456_i0~~NODE_496_length_2180_cov_18.490380_g456_i0.p1  ORF type:complete len:342 (-),score=-43.01 NODE_496_length_2180_cov_18.490380_g456_i0:293-1318(-)